MHYKTVGQFTISQSISAIIDWTHFSMVPYTLPLISDFLYDIHAVFSITSLREFLLTLFFDFISLALNYTNIRKKLNNVLYLCDGNINFYVHKLSFYVLIMHPGVTLMN